MVGLYTGVEGLVGRRQLKARHLLGLDSRVALGQLTSKEAETFRLMYAKCHSEADFKQVREAMESFMTRSVPTRFTRILDDDFLGDEA